MSRSYKKNPYVTDHKRKTSKAAKRRANHIFRYRIALEEDMAARPKHKAYSCSWNISDYSWRMTEEEAIAHWYEMYDDLYFRRTYPTLESYIEFWNKCYRRK